MCGIPCSFSATAGRNRGAQSHAQQWERIEGCRLNDTGRPETALDAVTAILFGPWTGMIEGDPIDRILLRYHIPEYAFKDRTTAWCRTRQSTMGRPFLHSDGVG